ncbi:MAG: BolA family protein [Thiolinea sp.]
MHNVPPSSESHFKVTIVSDEFEGKALVARHRMINKGFKCGTGWADSCPGPAYPDTGTVLPGRPARSLLHRPAWVAVNNRQIITQCLTCRKDKWKQDRNILPPKCCPGRRAGS